MCTCAIGNRRLLARPAQVATTCDGGTRAGEMSTSAAQLLRDSITVDLHSHARGMVFQTEPDGSLAASMRTGQLSAVCLSHVPDCPIIGRNAEGAMRQVRTATPGDLYKGHLKRLDWADRLVRDHGMRRANSVADLRQAKSAGDPAIIQDIEGCDFLDGRLERLEEAYSRGVRVVQLVHYADNDIGDFQTGPEIHGGMTEFGARVVRELNRLGVVVDVAHASESMLKRAAQVTTRPLLLSHTALRGSKAQGNTHLTGRQVSPDQARAIAETGGVIGLWHFFPDLDRYVLGIKEMVDVVGADHVGIGTDQWLNVGAIPDYAGYGNLADKMLKGGFTAQETAKILGENFLRVWSLAAVANY